MPSPFNLGGYGVFPSSPSYDPAFVSSLVNNLTSAYCTPYTFSPPLLTGALFVPPKFVVKIDTGSCVFNS